MNRKDKIKALQAVRAGLLMPEDIRERKIYLFNQRLDKPGHYEKEGEIFTPVQVEQFSKQIEEINTGRQAAGMEPDIVIIMNYENGPLSSSRGVTLNFD